MQTTVSVEYWQMGVEVKTPGHGKGWGLIRDTHPGDSRVKMYYSHRLSMDGADPIDCIVSVEVYSAGSAERAIQIVLDLGLTPVSLRGQYTVYGQLRLAEQEAKAAAKTLLGFELPWWDDRFIVS